MAEQSPLPTLSTVSSQISFNDPADIVCAFIQSPAGSDLKVTDLPNLISTVYGAVNAAREVRNEGAPAAPSAPLEPAVSIKKSITPDYLICLDDGRKLKSLKRHLATLGMTPEEYRRRWGLPADYPMVAPNYAAQRSALAKQMGLGTKARGGGRKPARKR